MSDQFREAGFQLVAPDNTADVYIANTCTVTHIADRKSRHWLRLAKRKNPGALIIGTGCYAQRAPWELGELADLVLDNGGKEHLLEIVKGLSLPAQIPSRLKREGKDEVEVKQSYFPNGLARARSLVKIQDGCHSQCTYCIVPRVRPREYSVPVFQIVKEIEEKVSNGYKEVILTGTKIGCYKDAILSASEGSIVDLRGLVKQILDNIGVRRLRLSSLQPQEISPEFLVLWQDSALSRSSEPKLRAKRGGSERTSEGFRLCRHFHLALQSGSDAVLQRMRRGYSLRAYQKTMDLIRETIPEVAITTDIMVGFPEESDEEFEQSYHFCQEAGFANIHVFPFSPRPGTQAAKMPNQVKVKVKKERTQRMLELAQNCRHSFCERFLGQTMPVLWEAETSLGDGVYSGLTDNYIRVFTQSKKPLTNKIVPVMLARFHSQGMWGELISENPGQDKT